MKAFLAQHKYYVLAAVFIALGGLYYFFIYLAEPSSNQQITALDKNAAPADEAVTQDEQKPKAEKTATVIVDVKGEIKQPGVYSSSTAERVIDVIQRAGGLTEKADESQVNFAAHVQDEMVIYIPAKGAAGANPAPANPVPAQSFSGGNLGTNQNGKININKADSNELQNLPGIGPAKAASIIQYREENGPFQSIEDLKNISGIGDKTYDKLKEAISVQ